MQSTKDSRQTEEDVRRSKREKKEEGYLLRSFVWVFQTPDGRFVQTGIERHLKKNWWDVVLGVVVVGRVLFRLNKWLQ